MATKPNGGLVHLWMNLRPINSYAEEPQCVALDDVEVRCLDFFVANVDQHFHRQVR